MTLQSRDKKILVAVVPVLILFSFWFLILAPKRAESGRLGAQLTKVQAKRDSAVAAAGKLQGARNSYADDYATVVRLGKAVPASLDMPSLLVQLESAAKGTNIDFDSIKAGVRTTAPTTSAPASSTSGSTSGGGGSSAAPPAASGGAPAQTSAGKATEKAGDAKNTANQSSAASSSAASGSAANTGGAAPAAGAPTTTGAQAPGLDSVPLEFTFTGGFFDLADFFHRMKRFVHLTNERIRVQGRLITIDSLDFTTDTFPELSASVKATVYLSPKDQGTTAGATPAGPQATPASAPTGSSTGTQSTSTPPTSGAP